jgi:hypothetical protein
MTIFSSKAAKKALLERKREIRPFDFTSYLFEPQLKFIKDPSPFKVAVCSRRAGKSTVVACDLVETAYTTPNCTSLYITGTRTDAKKIIWQEALKFNREHKLGGIANISELTISFPNGSIVRLSGAKDEQEIEKIRGQLPPVKKVFIDEAQSIRDRVLTKLIDDVLEAALLDYAGSICITGTPGSIPTGYFYRISHNLDERGQKLPEAVWASHSWTFFDNPHIATKSKTSHQVLLNRVLKRRGVSMEDPSIQREFFGKWTLDSDSLLIKYSDTKNHFAKLPDITPKQYHYVMGIDLGFDDADAIAILAYSDLSPITYLVEEKVVAQQGLTELVEQINYFQKKYPISKMVIDQGGLGKKLAEELRRRHQIPVQAADKTRKMENIALMNDALRTGKLMAPKDSKFAQDSYLVEIDKDKSTPDRVKVSDKYHSDIIDAVLYAFRESPAFAYQDPIVPPKHGTPEWYEEQVDEMFEQEMERLKEREAAANPFFRPDDEF